MSSSGVWTFSDGERDVRGSADTLEFQGGNHAPRFLGLGDELSLQEGQTVTFTVAATDELITRVRRALSDAVGVFCGAISDRAEHRTLFELLDDYYPAPNAA